MTKSDNFARARSVKEISQCANAWREAFGFRDSWSPDVIHIVENLLPQLDEDFTLLVGSERRMGQQLGLTKFFPPQIWLREDVYEKALQQDGRSRFTVAHEIGHFLLHSGEARPRDLSVVNERIAERFRSVEWQADCFAAAFLMPEHIVRQFSKKLELAQCCNVSVQAAENRMRSLGLLNEKRPLPPIVQEFLEKNRKLRKKTDF